MRETVKQGLMRCDAVYPSFGQVDEDRVKARLQVFLETIAHAGLTKEQVVHAFREHLAHGPKRFPLPSDICGAAEPVTMYRLDHGPYGFGGLYFRDEPYAQQQIAAGVQIEARQVQIPAGEAAAYRQQRVAAERSDRVAALPGPGPVMLGIAAGFPDDE